MKERLLGFIFCAILLAFAVNLTLDSIHHRFSDSLWFQSHWVLFYVAIPRRPVAGAGLVDGLFRPRGARWADALVLLMVALTVYTMLGAGYSCWKYCF